MKLTKFQKSVYTIVRQIPCGKVATYGMIARMMDSPAASRAVGNALNRNTSPQIFCHRVIRSDGFVGGFNRGMSQKATMLRNEGIVVRGGIIDLDQYIWKKSLK